MIQDLLKHTSEDHPDHSLLLDAQRDIKRLAEKINKGRRSAEEAEREARVIQEIEAHIEGVEHVSCADKQLAILDIFCLLDQDYTEINQTLTADVCCCVFVLDSESAEEVLETGNSHGGGKLCHK